MNDQNSKIQQFFSAIVVIWLKATNLVLPQPKTPATNGAAGTKGQVVWDSDYIYVCIEDNHWKRVSISDW